mmetsp:Transcript_23944/g.36672  ORF Transcript_23944/g.36672 Transcript_23944/m.36672 type:complete len:141 (+) Transcript_23944:295-717(+)
MIFELIADYRRWTKDSRLNNVKVGLVSFRPGSNSPEVQMARSQDLQVGDVIQLKNKSLVPADCLLLRTDEASGTAFINTANLDGERSLKPKHSLSITQNALGDFISEKNPAFVYGQPSKDIYYFNGHIEAGEDRYDFSLS